MQRLMIIIIITRLQALLYAEAGSLYAIFSNLVYRGCRLVIRLAQNEVPIPQPRPVCDFGTVNRALPRCMTYTVRGRRPRLSILIDALKLVGREGPGVETRPLYRARSSAIIMFKDHGQV